MRLEGSRFSRNIGKGFPIAVNVSLGTTDATTSSFQKEIKKIEALANLNEKPDLMMDLSIGNRQKYLYDEIRQNIGCPIGIIPCYFAFSEDKGLNPERLIFEMERAADSGVSWFVIHLTLNKERVKQSMLRKYPLSSRSAVLLLKDMIKNKRSYNIYWSILDDVIRIAKKYNISISLGAAFRPATISDTLDIAHLSELNDFHRIIKIFKKENIALMLEGIGHCDVTKIDRFVSLINKFNLPVMPLGPLFKDSFDKDDHLSNAMGFFTSIIRGANFSIINSITSAEHSGGIPGVYDIIEGYNTARACANSCNEFLGFSTKNMKNQCLESQYGKSGCNRCNRFCPTQYFIQYKKDVFNFVSINS